MDNKLKNELSKIKDNIELPDSYKFKFKKTLDTLPQHTTNSRTKFKSYKVSFIAAIVASISIGCMVFGEDVTENVSSIFFKNKPISTIGKKTKIESINTIVNKSDEHDGVKFTLDNMSIDDNFLVCSYTLELDEEKANLLANAPNSMLNFNPYICYEINNKEIYSQCGIDTETDSYKESNSKITFIQRISLGNFDIEDTGNLKVNFNGGEFSNDLFGLNWVINTTYDKTKAKTYTKKVDVNKKVSFNNNITVKKVCFSPLGNQITIEEYGNTEDGFTPLSSDPSSFILLDDKNNTLTIANSHVNYYDNKAITSIDFMTSNKDISSLKLVPIYETDVEVPLETPLYDLDNMPSSIDLGDTKVLINNVSKENNKIKIEYKYDGPISHYYLEGSIYDENGNQLGDKNDHGFLDHSIDRNNNSFIEYYGFYTEANFQKAKKISFYMDSPIEIKYDETYTIDLNK